MALSTRTRGLRLLVVLLALFTGVIWAAIEGDDISEEMASSGDLVFVPSPGLVKMACLGYDNLMSDMFWLRTVRYVHNQQKSAKRFDMLMDMLDVVTRLDPYTCDVYKRGGCWLYQDAERPNDGIGFLQKGLQLVPEREKNRWELAYYLGECFREVLYDEESATHYFEIARSMPDSPHVLTVAVAAGYERQGRFDRATKLWEQARDYIDAKQVPADFSIDDYRAAVKTKAEDLMHLLGYFEQRFGYQPKDLRALIAAGLIQELPEPPVVCQIKIIEIRTTLETMENLRNKVSAFNKRFGHLPSGFPEMIDAGLLDKTPEPAIRDAGGQGRFELMPSGKIEYSYVPEELEKYL